MEATVEFSKRIGKVPACEALGASRASLYRKLRPVPKATMSAKALRGYGVFGCVLGRVSRKGIEQ